MNAYLMKLYYERRQYISDQLSIIQINLRISKRWIRKPSLANGTVEALSNNINKMESQVSKYTEELNYS